MHHHFVGLSFLFHLINQFLYLNFWCANCRIYLFYLQIHRYYI
nr:MAG TPA: Thioredoxin [Crassvirales sp.]